MEKNVARQLVTALEKQSAVKIPGKVKDNLLKALEAAHVRENSSRFHESLPELRENDSLIDGKGFSRKYFYLQPRRILRNRNAIFYQLSKAKQMYEALASIFGIYDSDVLTRKIRADKNLVDAMIESDSPFSLLGKLRMFDYDNPEEILYEVENPILVIPGIKNHEPVKTWEANNTRYYRDRRLFTQRISQEEYHST